MATSPWFWVAFNAFVLVLLALDLGVFHRKAHAVRPREAAMWTAIWASLALLFCAGLWVWQGSTTALTFLTGYVIEQSLSADNIFVIVLIFRYFRIPGEYQHRVLFWGIIGALVMRGAFIAVGALLIERFHWILYLFGAFLVFTGIRMGVQKEQDEFDADKNIVMRTATRFFPFTKRMEGQNFFTLEKGRRVGTPLLLVLLMVEFTDLIFAVDSIPAIFAVTTDPFLVYTSNVFAILGLRSLYFLLADIIHRFHYLHYGLAVILTFVGVKMLVEKWVHLAPWVSLLVIVTVLAVSVIASLKWPEKAQPPEEGPTVTTAEFEGRPRERVP